MCLHSPPEQISPEEAAALTSAANNPATVLGGGLSLQVRTQALSCVGPLSPSLAQSCPVHARLFSPAFSPQDCFLWMRGVPNILHCAGSQSRGLVRSSPNCQTRCSPLQGSTRTRPWRNSARDTWNQGHTSIINRADEASWRLKAIRSSMLTQPLEPGPQVHDPPG